MGETRSQSVLGRIAAAGREDHQARAMTLQKAMRVTLAKVADAQMNLPLAVIGAVVQQVQSDGLAAVMRDDAMLIQLDGPTMARGAVLVDPALVGGLIQQQTMGTVRPDTGQPRAMTRTDAAICAPLLDAVFERVPEIVDSSAEARLVDGFRFGVKADDVRSLLMMLEADEYTVLRLTLDMARGTRQGEMLVILPKPDLRSAEHPAEAGGEVEDQPQLSKVVMGLNAELNMVLCRMNLSLKSLQALRPGDVLAVPAGQFPNVQITTGTGRVVGEGAVGHVDGVRAVKPKRKPLHATQPLRRASDEDLVDMPDVEEIGGERRVGALVAEDTALGDADPMVADLPDLADLDTLPDLSSAGTPMPDLPDLPEASDFDLPALDDLPDLADLPDLEQMAIAN